MIKIPYGISNYAKLIKRGNYYVDRTMYIERLEEFTSDYLFFVRPRRFGKSLFISMLEYYYGVQYKDEFKKLFSDYYIGQHPTEFANQYLVLVFDFSQVDTSSFENTYRTFLNNVKDGVLTFLGLYAEFFDKKDVEEAKAFASPAEVVQYLFRLVRLKAPKRKIYLLIDEYDHFANEILAFRFEDFSRIVSQNGYVRKFYESLKIATRNDVIDRMFVTGVSSITLDSLTSGFNIATNISLEEQFNAMIGFKEQEVTAILKGVEVPDLNLEATMEEVKKWYDGYLFSNYAQERIYNSDMVLYFADHYGRKKRYPDDLLDTNIASDYTKIRRLFKVKNKEKEHLTYLDELLKTGYIKARLVKEFNFERRFDRHDFISLLYYTGIITIHKEILDEFVFKMPNYVIQQLYFQYFHQIIIEQSLLDGSQIDVHTKIKALALDSNLQPLVNYTESVLTQLSTRDKRKFDEKYVKVIFTAALFNSGVYTIHNEFEVQKSAAEKGFLDILLVRRPPYEPTYQFAIELKYLKKANAQQAQSVKKEAISQLKNYLLNDDYLQKLTALKAFVVLFVGNEGMIEEVELI